MTPQTPAVGQPLDAEDADGWVEHQGGPMPVFGGRIEVKLRSGDCFTGSNLSDDRTWLHIWGNGDIIAWRPAPHAPSSAHPEPASQGREEEAGPAEREVGRAIYGRIERLMDLNPKPNTSEWVELDYLSHLAESVEEAGGYDGPAIALASPTQDEPLGVDLGELKRLADRISRAADDKRYPRFADMMSASEGILKLIAEIERRGRK